MQEVGSMNLVNECRTRQEELARLREFVEKMKRDPALAHEVLMKAGIVDEEGKLTEHYRQHEDE
jgi:hypothetical protein